MVKEEVKEYIMEPIKFNIEELKNNQDGFSYYLLGRSYDLEENGITRDYNKALEYYNMGLNIDYPLCEYSLGISLYYGLGDVLPVDKEKGNQLLIDAYPKILKLINGENTSYEEKVYAKFVTGAYSYFGLGQIPLDKSEAFKIIKDCASWGHIGAIYDLGANFYYNGVGTQQDLKKAEEYLKLAKDAGLPRAIEAYEKYDFKSRN